MILGAKYRELRNDESLKHVYEQCQSTKTKVNRIRKRLRQEHEIIWKKTRDHFEMLYGKIRRQEHNTLVKINAAYNSFYNKAYQVNDAMDAKIKEITEVDAKDDNAEGMIEKFFHEPMILVRTILASSVKTVKNRILFQADARPPQPLIRVNFQTCAVLHFQPPTNEREEEPNFISLSKTMINLDLVSVKNKNVVRPLRFNEGNSSILTRTSRCKKSFFSGLDNIPARKLDINDFEMVQLTHVNALDDFFVTKEKDKEDLNQLRAAIENKIKSGTVLKVSRVEELTSGAPVLAQRRLLRFETESDQVTWARAVVRGHEEADGVKRLIVNFIDSGCETRIDHDKAEIYRGDTDLFSEEFPIFAIQ